MDCGALGSVHPICLLPSLPPLAVIPAEARRFVEVARPGYERVLAQCNRKLTGKDILDRYRQRR
jgi:hypothetical protein